MPRQVSWLLASRLTTIIDELQDQRRLMNKGPWSGRVTTVPANKGEMYGEYLGSTSIAPVIALNAPAPTFRAGRISSVSTSTTKIKHGAHFTEEDLDELMNMQEMGSMGAPSGREVGMADTVVMNTQSDLLLGLEWRKEAYIMAMLLDSLQYSGYGIAVNGSWGRPADLKVTPTVPWTDHTNADPVLDVMSLKNVALQRYGLDLTRMTMSLQVLREVIQCAKFQLYAKAFIPQTLTISTINIQDYGRWRPLVEQTMGVTVEINDSRYDIKNEDGATTSARFQPIEKVILTDPNNDNNPGAMDYANAPVVEASLMSEMPGSSMIGKLPAARRGPISFATYEPTWNPPGMTIWAVQNAFPRAKKRALAGVLTVGTLTDEIPFTQAFPAA